MTQISGMAALGRNADGDAAVFLLQKPQTDDLVHIAQCGVVFGGKYQTLGAAVEPVAQRGSKRGLGLRVVFAPLGKHVLKHFH